MKGSPTGERAGISAAMAAHDPGVPSPQFAAGARVEGLACYGATWRAMADCSLDRERQTPPHPAANSARSTVGDPFIAFLAA